MKARGINNAQIWILYRLVRQGKDDSFELECHKIETKRREGKTYIKNFGKYIESFVIAHK